MCLKDGQIMICDFVKLYNLAHLVDCDLLHVVEWLDDSKDSNPNTLSVSRVLFGWVPQLCVDCAGPILDGKHLGCLGSLDVGDAANDGDFVCGQSVNWDGDVLR